MVAEANLVSFASGVDGIIGGELEYEIGAKLVIDSGSLFGFVFRDDFSAIFLKLMESCSGQIQSLKDLILILH